MVGVLSGPISTSFNSFSELSWVQTTFPIGASISQPLSGHLTDIYGRRKGLVFCYFLFATGTLLCGLAPSLWIFLLGRIIEGLGGGAIVSITAFVETDLVPLRKRALIEGIGNIAFGVTLALGGVYGGSINQAIGWRWTFLCQPPVIVLDAVLVILVVRIPRQKTDSSSLRRIDYFGCGSLVLSIIFLQLALNSGASNWNSPVVIVSFTIATISFALFLYWDSGRASNPVIPIRAMIERTVASAQSSFFLSSAANVTIIFYIPIYLQVLGHSTGESGLHFIPMAIGLALSSIVTGYLVKTTGRYYYINMLVQGFSVMGTALLCTMTRDTPAWAPFVFLGLTGIGYGGAFVTRLMGILSSVDDDRQAVIQGASWTIESIGLALGITVASTVFQKISVGGLQGLLAGQPVLLDALLKDIAALQPLSSPEKETIIDVYMKASRGVFFVALAEMVLAAVSSFIMKNNLLMDSPTAELTEME